MTRRIIAAATAMLGIVTAGPALAQSIASGGTAVEAVPGSASAYQVFGHSGSPGGGGAASDAVLTTFAAGSGNVFTFNATGLINWVGNTPDSGPDGYSSMISIIAANGLSGLSGNAGVPLVGVFTSDADPFGGTAPMSLTFDATAPTGLSPLLNQVFYIGDGHAGFYDPTGSLLQFTAPDAATRLYLGIVDAGDFNGQPGYYSDNTGSFTVSVSLAGTVAAVPEPGTWAMMIVGFGVAGTVLRRRRQSVAAKANVA